MKLFVAWCIVLTPFVIAAALLWPLTLLLLAGGVFSWACKTVSESGEQK